MQIAFDKDAWKDYLYWQDKDKINVKRINQLILDILRNPTEGIGKPEALKHDLSGCWSRRINKEHRLVYKVYEKQIVILACRYHY